MKNKVMAVGLLIASLGVGSVAVTGTSAATPHAARPAAAAAASGSREFLLVTSVNHREGVVAHGVFTGAGKDVAHGQRDLLKLGGGTVTLRHPNQQAHFVRTINPKSCFATFTIKGKYRLAHGTGKYKGVRGHGTYHARGQTVFPHKSNGTCDAHGTPRMQVFYIHGSGPASLS